MIVFMGRTFVFAIGLSLLFALIYLIEWLRDVNYILGFAVVTLSLAAALSVFWEVMEL